MLHAKINCVAYEGVAYGHFVRPGNGPDEVMEVLQGKVMAGIEPKVSLDGDFEGTWGYDSAWEDAMGEYDGEPIEATTPFSARILPGAVRFVMGDAGLAHFGE